MSEEEAREHLARQYEKSGVPDFARRVRSVKEFGAVHGGIALRAIQSAADGERAAIIKWLRGDPWSIETLGDPVADAIERGDHLSNEKPS